MNKPVLAGVAAAALVAGLIAAWRPATVAAAPVAGPPAKASTVTLITGDKVTLRGKNMTFTPARDHPTGSYLNWTDRYGDVHVVPDLALPAVRDGRLDGRLFDVSGLIRQGYDDAGRPDLPLLVSGTVRPAGVAARALPAAHLTAMAAPKARAGQVWRSLPATAKVWLDARVRAADTDTLARVGAPDAWAAGYTGAGVTVAVLDSGYDETHPDLAGKVASAQDFTGGGSVHDAFGHGTHVASILAGTGAATHEVGVAKDASLIVGKVLGDDGYGQESWILAGLAWAAPRARIVNLSVGGPPTDGTDPVSQAVNTLTAQYGTLFVVAAGNDSRTAWVESPATADAALAVAAVSKQDSRAAFSSQGPRRGDAALKPDISAPGVDVVAARAAGTTMGAPRDRYATALSGTSMAAPHVAGGAALLAQEHPDWKADQLKVALMDSAHPISGTDVYGQGAGRLDLVRATHQQVRATAGSLSMGYLAVDAAPVTKSVTYADDTGSPVTLALSTDVTGVTLGAGSVTVPAHGTASVPVTFTPASGQPGVSYGGWITATSGDTTVRVTVGATLAPTSHQVTADLIDREGRPYSAAPAYAFDMTTGDMYFLPSGQPAELPEGRYLLFGFTLTPRPHREPATTLIADPELRVDRDTHVVLDARSAHPVDVAVDRPGATGIVNAEVEFANGPVGGGSGIHGRYGDKGGMYLGTVPGAGSSSLFYTEVRAVSLAEPWLDLSFAAGGGKYTVPAGWWGARPGLTGNRSLPAVAGGRGRPEDLAGRDLAGALVLLTPTEDDGPDLPARLAAIAKAGAAMVMFANGWPDMSDEPPLPAAGGSGPEADWLLERASAGPVTVAMRATATSPYAYELAFRHPRTVPADPTYRVHDADLALTRTLYRTMGSDGLIIGGSVLVGPAWQEVYRRPGSWTVDAYPCACFGEFTDAGQRDYRKGRNPDEAWNSAVVGPEVRYSHSPWNQQALTRSGDVLRADVPILADPAGLAYLQYDPLDADGYTRLSRDGQLVATIDRRPGEGEFTGVRGEATYRLDAEVRRSEPWWELSTDVSGSWTFRSAHVDGTAVLPLLAVRFSPRLDPTNTAPAGRRFTFPVTVQHTDTATAPVTTLAVQVSYDDGRTWQPVTVAGHGDTHGDTYGDTWTATVDHPAGPGYVSLRGQARDQDGNTVEETILRAYRLE